MVRSTKAEMMALHAEVFHRSEGRCEWPGCVDPGAQLAHLHHRGMGGSKEANRLDNAALLCDLDHDVLDGRVGLQLTIWRIRTAFVACLQARRSPVTSQGSTQPQMDIGYGDGRSDPTHTSKLSNIASSRAESPQPRTSTTTTTTAATTPRPTSKGSARQSTPDITTPRSTTRQHGISTKQDSAPSKSGSDLESMPPRFREDSDPEAGHSEALGSNEPLNVTPYLTSTSSETCTWPGCEQAGSLAGSVFLETPPIGSSESLDWPLIPQDAHLCETHMLILLDGRTGLGTLRWELNEMLRYVIG